MWMLLEVNNSAPINYHGVESVRSVRFFPTRQALDEWCAEKINSLESRAYAFHFLAVEVDLSEQINPADVRKNLERIELRRLMQKFPNGPDYDEKVQ